MNNEETEKVIYNQDEDEELTSSLFGKNDIETDEKEDFEENREGSPVWQDEDDENTEINISHKRRTRKLLKSEEERNVNGIEYNKRLREFYEMRHPNAKYIKRQKTEADDSDEEFFMRDSTSKTLDKKSTILEANIISVQRLKDANISKYSKCVIQSVQFHPSGQLLLTAGFDKTVRIFKIDGKKNILFNSIFFDGFPIIQSSFINNGDNILSICKDRKNIFVYDLKEGKSQNIPNIMGRKENGYPKFSVSPDYKYIALYGSNGYIILIDGTSYRWLYDYKINGPVYAVTFSTDSQYLYGGGVGGDVYIWNLETNKCIKRFHDEGSMKITCISVSSNGYCAVGSNSGIVNVYVNILENVNEKNPKPLKTFKNLTTYVGGIKFNHDNQIMAMYSFSEKNQLKLVHLPTMTVYSNWPTKESPLEYVHDVDFSPNSGYIAIGNAKGRVLLYRLNHYSQA